MATTAKQVSRLTLGPTVTENDKAIALREITRKINELIEQHNQLVRDLSV